MEKVRIWCGQPSDRGRLKNSTEQNYSVLGFWPTISICRRTRSRTIFSYNSKFVLTPRINALESSCIQTLRPHTRTRAATTAHKPFGLLGDIGIQLGRNSGIELRLWLDSVAQTSLIHGRSNGDNELYTYR